MFLLINPSLPILINSIWFTVYHSSSINQLGFIFCVNTTYYVNILHMSALTFDLTGQT